MKLSRLKLAICSLLLSLASLTPTLAAGTLTASVPAIQPSSTFTVSFSNPSGAYTTTAPVMAQSGSVTVTFGTPVVDSATAYHVAVTAPGGFGTTVITDGTATTGATLDVMWTHNPAVVWTLEHHADFTTRGTTTASTTNDATHGVGTANDYTDEAGNVWAVTSGVLNTTGSGLGSLPSQNYGLYGQLDRPAPALSQRLVQSGLLPSAATVGNNLQLHINYSAHQTYVVEATSSALTTTAPRIYYINAGAISGLDTPTVGTATMVGGAAGTGHVYQYEGETVPGTTGTTTVNGSIIDLGTSGTPAHVVIWSSHVLNDTSAGVQTAGTVGMGNFSGRNWTNTLDTYTVVAPSISVSPSSATLNSTVTANITAIGGVNLTGETFTVSGASGVKVSQSITDSTHATVTLTTGTTPGTITITAVNAGQSAAIVTSPISTGATTAGTVGVLSVPSLATIAATNGNPPYTYALTRGTTAGAAQGGGGGTVVSTQTALAAGVAPSPVSDTPPSGTWVYSWGVTDATGQTVYTAPLIAGVPDKHVQALIIGNSRHQGVANSSYLVGVQWATLPTISVFGSGYTSAPTVTATGGAGTGAHFTAQINGSGQVVGVWPDARGIGYTANAAGSFTAEPTLSFSGGGGSGAAVNTTTQAYIGGGPVLFAEDDLRSFGGGIHDVTLFDCAINGAHTDSFIDTLGSYLYAAVSEASVNGGTTVCLIDNMINDVNSNYTTAATKANLLNTGAYLIAHGYTKIALSKDYPQPAMTAAHYDLLMADWAAVDQIIASDPVHYCYGDVKEGPYFATHPEFLTDSLHANDQGQSDLGRMDAEALAPLLGIAPTTTSARQPSRGR